MNSSNQYLHHLFTQAFQQRVSDIHFEPYESQFRVRFRRDGVLCLAPAPEQNVADTLPSLLKVMANLDTTDKRLPQDGRIKYSLSDTITLDMRVSTIPTLWGEKLVLRLLENHSIPLQITSLGLSEEQQSFYLSALNKPQGLVLITGPTGSGKTVTLYTALKLLNKMECNISTVEDPVEINLQGINQIQINEKIGLHFVSTLKAILRQDPDIIMIGEIRDKESAEIAIKAAQTGHLVLSTLHTNSACESIPRLVNMGINRFALASSLSLIMAQRLVRKLCIHCRILTDEPNIYQANQKGCDYCHNGYTGREGVYEALPITNNIINAIESNRESSQIESTALENGFNTLLQSGEVKLRTGITSREELTRVLFSRDEL